MSIKQWEHLYGSWDAAGEEPVHIAITSEEEDQGFSWLFGDLRQEPGTRTASPQLEEPWAVEW